MAESAGVEPARPFGLVALAPRCLAARPTLQVEPPAGFEPALARGRNPALYPLSYEGTLVGEAGLEPAACGVRIRRAANCATPQCHGAPVQRREAAPLHGLVADVVVPSAAVEATRARAAAETGAAMEALSRVPSGPARETLAVLARALVGRDR